MSESPYMRGFVTVGVVPAVILIVTGIGSIADAFYSDVGSGMAVLVPSRCSPGCRGGRPDQPA
jgi:hypothetical protein